jgi:hypothetical protein
MRPVLGQPEHEPGMVLDGVISNNDLAFEFACVGAGSDARMQTR